MMSIELLLDEESDAAIRRQWDRLKDAGLPSLASHTGASNAPHITLMAAASIGTTGLEPVLASLPLPVRLGGWIVFGQPPRSLVLGRAVIATSELLVLHRVVAALARDTEETAATTEPVQWTPHVTLASRLTPRELGDSIELLGARGIPDETREVMTAIAARHWDGTQKVVTMLAPPVYPSDG